MFFLHFWNEKQQPKGDLKYGGVPSVWRGEGDSEEKLFWQGPVRKYVPKSSIRDGGSTAYHTAYTVETVDTDDTINTVYTVDRV